MKLEVCYASRSSQLFVLRLLMKDTKYLEKFGIWVAKDYVEPEDHIEDDGFYAILWAPAYNDTHEPGQEEYVPFGSSVGMGSSEFTVREEADLFYDALLEYETSGN